MTKKKTPEVASSKKKIWKATALKAVKFNPENPEKDCLVTYWAREGSEAPKKYTSDLKTYRRNGGKIDSQEFIEAARATNTGTAWLKAYEDHQAIDEGVDISDHSSTSNITNNASFARCICVREVSARLDALNTKIGHHDTILVRAHDKVQTLQQSLTQLELSLKQLGQSSIEHSAIIEFMMKILEQGQPNT